jgi:HIRAN domain
MGGVQRPDTIPMMGLLDLFRRPPRLSSASTFRLPEDGFMRVVGESHYQATLRRLRGRCRPGAEGRPSFPVALMREPDNPHDEHAVAVMSDFGRIGYLPRDDARRYGPTLRVLQREGYAGASCRALLNGGTRDRPSVGVTLCVAYPEDCEVHLGLRSETDDKPTTGRVRGRHYTDYVENVRELRRSDKNEAAERLLLELVDAIEEESSVLGTGVAPWYYEQLAVIYRKRKDHIAEVAVLERYASQPHAPGAGPAKLSERLTKARSLL